MIAGILATLALAGSRPSSAQEALAQLRARAEAAGITSADLPAPPAVQGAPAVDIKRIAAQDNAPLETGILADLRLARRAQTARAKADVIKDVGALKGVGSRPYKVERFAGVMGGQYKVFPGIPEGYYAGSFGAGPCIGLIIHSPDQAHVFHFTATDDALRTLRRAGPFPKGSRAALFGGDGSGHSNATLELAMDYLKANKAPIKIDGYSDTHELWVGEGGKYFTAARGQAR